MKEFVVHGFDCHDNNPYLYIMVPGDGLLRYGQLAANELISMMRYDRFPPITRLLEISMYILYCIHTQDVQGDPELIQWVLQLVFEW